MKNMTGSALVRAVPQPRIHARENRLPSCETLTRPKTSDRGPEEQGADDSAEHEDGQEEMGLVLGANVQILGDVGKGGLDRRRGDGWEEGDRGDDRDGGPLALCWLVLGVGRIHGAGPHYFWRCGSAELWWMGYASRTKSDS